MEEREVTEQTVENEVTEPKTLSEAESAPPQGTPVETNSPAEAKEGTEAPADAKAEGAEKPLSKKRRIINAVILAIQILFVVFAITICLVVMLNPSSNDKVSPLGLKLLPVLTGSMEGDKKDSFPKGALVFAVNPKNHGEGLKVGDVVTFTMFEENSGQMILVTHRIIELVLADGEPSIEEGGVYRYRTQGDANPIPDDELKAPSEILAVYAFHINGLGAALTWVREGYHFIYIIIIPLALLLIYNIYLVAQIVVESKMKKAKAAAAQRALESIDEEAIKRKAIEEYLKSQGINPSGESGEKGDNKQG